MRPNLRRSITTLAVSALAAGSALVVAAVPATPAFAVAPSALIPCEHPSNGNYTASIPSVIDTTTLTWPGTALIGQDVGGVAVFSFDDLTVATSLSVVGSRPLALLSTGSIVVSSVGQISVVAGSAGGGAGGPVAAAGSGPGAGGGGTGGSSGGGGGGFGGIGGSGGFVGGTGGPVYGDLTANVQGGSGGGGGTTGSGGDGGGAIVLVADQSVTINGDVRAKGENVVQSGGGGSGGAIVVRAPVIGGGGGVSAGGGGGGNGDLGDGGGGGGGGGRILLTTNSGTFGITDVLPGPGGSPGGGGGAIGVLTTQTYDPATDACAPPPIEVGPPTGPFDVTATPGPASKQVTLAWTPANPNGSAITSYTWRCAAAAANPGLPTKTGITGPSRTSVLVGGLVAGKRYSCTVRATNGFGNGPNVTTTPLVVTAKA